MTEPLVERAELDGAFHDVARRLHAKGLHGELYVFGGTAMVCLGAADILRTVEPMDDLSQFGIEDLTPDEEAELFKILEEA